MNLPDCNFSVRNTKEAQLKLFKMGYEWASGSTRCLYLPGTDGQCRFLEVTTNKKIYKSEVKLKIDLTSVFTVEEMKVHKCLDNGVVYKQGDSYNFEPFTRDLLDPRFVDEWMDWLETQTWQT